jgi:amino acid transporter
MGLARRITAPGYFVLAFGTIVGSAWMVLMGEWVAPAGPGGAMLAFIAMCVMMVPMAGAYAELMARVPRAGSESVFVEAAFGGWAGFLPAGSDALFHRDLCVRRSDLGMVSGQSDPAAGPGRAALYSVW